MAASGHIPPMEMIKRDFRPMGPMRNTLFAGATRPDLVAKLDGAALRMARDTIERRDQGPTREDR